MITIKRREYEALDDIALIRACMDSTIREIQGKSFEIKSKAFKRLEAGERALLLFLMLYGHTEGGIAEFFCLSYLLSKGSVWHEFKYGIRYFGDYTLLNLIDEMEEVYAHIKKHCGKNGPEHPEDIHIIEDTDLQAAIKRLDKRMLDILPISVRLIGLYIRKHPHEFLKIEA